jgi:hypothetical protein
MRILMNKSEIKQIEIIEKLNRKEIIQATAAELMGKSTRSVRRRLLRYNESGAEGLVHRSRGKPSNRKTADAVCARVVALASSKYAGYGPTFLAEKLQENEHITLNRETVRLMLIKNGQWQKKRKRCKHRKWREPKEHLGQLVQLDGSPHKWIQGSDTYWTLIKFIDDATKRTYARFYPSEAHEHVVDLTIRYIKKYGKPAAVYTDRGGVYKVNKGNENNDLITQYERALSEIDIELKHAYSPQAKGRIERSFSTDQDRLVKELKLHNITTMEQANEFLETVYLPKHNERFERLPKNEIDLHISHNGCELADVFAVIEQRTVANDWTIKYRNKILQIESTRPAIVRPKDIVTVHERLDGTIYLTIRSSCVDFKQIQYKPILKREGKNTQSYKPFKPSMNHPWRRACSQRKADISTLRK